MPVAFDRDCPEPLQAALDHARRLCGVLESLETRHPDPHPWLVGRREEVELVVRLRLRDWRARRVSAEFAARSIGRYLDDLHMGATARLALPANVPLACCAVDEALTMPLAVAHGSSASREPSSAPAGPDHETWFDLDALVGLYLAGADGADADPTSRGGSTASTARRRTST